MAKGKPLTVVGFMTYEDGRVVPWDDLPYEERLRINKTWINRWEKWADDLRRQHPEDFRRLYESTPETTEEEWEEYYALFPEKRESHRAANTVTPT